MSRAGEEPSPEDIDQGRRTFFATVAIALGTSWLGGASAHQRVNEQARAGVAHSAAPWRATFGTLKHVDAGMLNVAYVETGPSDGTAVLLLHGWPYDVHTYAEVGSRLEKAGYRVIVPCLRGYGATRFRSAKSGRNGQQSAFAQDAVALLDALGVRHAIVGGCDWGARTANILAALWPERFRGMVSVSGYLIGNPAAAGTPLIPEAEYQWWYQYYFATDRGRAGYEKYRRKFARLIWRLASPRWQFDDSAFDNTAAAFDNPDHVAIVVHNYRWRLGLAVGEPHYDAVERRLAPGPTIQVPTITLEGDANGAPHPEPSAYAGKFTGEYEHRTVTGGIGHNLPQEAPGAFAQAIIDVDRMHR
jgi:pimeloyl-ACP methyl ester carboxylesterase